MKGEGSRNRADLDVDTRTRSRSYFVSVPPSTPSYLFPEPQGHVGTWPCRRAGRTTLNPLTKITCYLPDTDYSGVCAPCPVDRTQGSETIRGTPVSATDQVETWGLSRGDPRTAPRVTNHLGPQQPLFREPGTIVVHLRPEHRSQVL